MRSRRVRAAYVNVLRLCYFMIICQKTDTCDVSRLKCKQKLFESRGIHLNVIYDLR